MPENTPNTTLIPAPRVPITDGRGQLSREWYRFFLNLFNLTGSGSSTTTIVDLTLAPPYIDQTGEFAAAFQQSALLAAPPVQLGTLSSFNQDNVNYIGFSLDPSPAAPANPGVLSWNLNDGTLDVTMYNGVVGNICQQLDFYAKNTSGVTIPKGSSVMATGTVGASGKITIAAAVSDGTVNAEYMIGVAAEDILDNAFGYVVSFGLVRGFDTSGTPVGETWADGDVLYFNPTYAGKLTKVQPLAPAVGTASAIVLTASSGGSGSIFVRMKTGEYLHDLHDVNTTGAVTGNALIYNATTGLWVPGTPSITAVSSISFGSTGLTPSTATTGAVTVAGTLGVPNGGTGATTLTGYVKGSGTSALTASSTIPGSDISGNISGNAANVTGTVAVANGGTGATTLTGYVYGNGTSAMTASATIPGSAISGNISGNAANVTGTVAIANGGTGATTASGARTNLGLGTMAQQDANNVNITYGFLSSVNITNSSFSNGSISLLGTPLAVADGGTGASTASGARTNLGLAIGTDIVAYSHVGSGGTQHAAMVGATAGAAGTAGFVPQPAAGDNGKFLRGDGTWASAAGGGTVTSITAGTGLTGGTITSSGTIAIDTATVVTLTDTQTLTNKTISSATSISTTDGTLYPLIRANSQATTSGTSFDFTGLPSWVKRVSFNFTNVSLSGTDNMLIRLGTSSGFVTSGYTSTSVRSGNAGDTSTVGFIITANGASRTFSGSMVLSLIGSNVWTQFVSGRNDSNSISGGGNLSLGGTLTQVRLLATGTDTFDSGTVSIIYEG